MSTATMQPIDTLMHAFPAGTNYVVHDEPANDDKTIRLRLNADGSRVEFLEAKANKEIFTMPVSVGNADVVIVLANIISLKPQETKGRALDTLTIDPRFCFYDAPAHPKLCFKNGFDDSTEAGERERAAMYVRLLEPEIAKAYAANMVPKLMNEWIEIRPLDGFGMATFARKDIPKGTRVFDVPGFVIPFPTLFSYCAYGDKHLVVGEGLQCLAHHCDPTTRVYAENNSMVSETVRDVKAGEMVAFNYNTNEWQMEASFDCSCGSPQCQKHINGLKHVPQEKWASMKPLYSQYVRDQIAAAGVTL